MAFDNSNDKNDLKLVRIDKKDSIGAFVEKCNYNFNQLLMHGGGVPGKDGIDGDRGAVGLSRNPIHVISDQLGLTNIDDVNAYLNDVLSNLEDLKVGDIILWNGGLYTILDDGGRLKLSDLLFSIKGDKGDSGLTSTLSDFNKYTINGDTYMYFKNDIVDDDKNTLKIVGLSLSDNLNKLSNTKTDTLSALNIYDSGISFHTTDKNFNTTFHSFIKSDDNKLNISSITDVNINAVNKFNVNSNVITIDSHGDGYASSNIKSEGDIKLIAPVIALTDPENECNILSFRSKSLASPGVSICYNKTTGTTGTNELYINDNSIALKLHDINTPNFVASTSINVGRINIHSEHGNYIDLISGLPDDTIKDKPKYTRSLVRLLSNISDQENPQSRIEIEANNVDVTKNSKFTYHNEVVSTVDGGFYQFLGDTTSPRKQSYTKFELRQQIGAVDENIVIPVGGIIMYYTLDVNQIPEQFHLCDGTRIDDLDLSNRYFDEDEKKNKQAIDRIKSSLKGLLGDNLPNLMNKFIYGASDDHEPFSTGGSKEVTLTKENLPEHSHYYSGSRTKEKVYERLKQDYGCEYNPINSIGDGSQGSGGNGTFVYKTGQKGLFNPQPQPIPIQPEFIAIPFIIRIY